MSKKSKKALTKKDKALIKKLIELVQCQITYQQCNPSKKRKKAVFDFNRE